MVRRVGAPDICDKCGDRIASTDYRHIGAYGHTVLCVPCFAGVYGGSIAGP